MTEYIAPLRDMAFVLQELVPFQQLTKVRGCEELNIELATAILEAAGEFASGVLSPLNAIGDREGARWHDGEVATVPGWRDAYAQFLEGGWNALACNPEFGGQGLPRLVSAMVEEMWNGASVAFTLCPMLTHGAIEAIQLRGSDMLKNTYLPKLVSGEWTGTMNLTEPQAGSDLAAVRTKAVPHGDGTYRVHGQKIFITYGEHDLTPNIIHLVLARTPNAPEGVRGLSLFVVPKFLVGKDGLLRSRNDVRCVSIEHKLGIHGSPTAVLAFGDKGGAVGWIVGEEGRGLEYMFIMMNSARFGVGLEGISLAERAYQRAVDYARTRTQGTEAGTASRDKVAILRHPDVRRILMSMRSRTEAMRALACVMAVSMDFAHGLPDAAEREMHQSFVDLMIPVVKGWSTENAIDIASLGIQVHGGMGFVEETGAAQHLRDARITTIYEGTTGIQAADLVGRKIARDGGRAVAAVIAQVKAIEAELAQRNDSTLAAIAIALDDGIAALERAVKFIVSTYSESPAKVLAGSVPFLELLGVVAGGWQMGRAALISHDRLRDGATDDFLAAKLHTARFYADHVISRVAALSHSVIHGSEATLAIEDRMF
jgi:acyl-CoA dehydrogenase